MSAEKSVIDELYEAGLLRDPTLERARRATCDPSTGFVTQKNILGWTLCRDRHGYWRAHRRVAGRLRSIYVGKDVSQAEQKIQAAIARRGEVLSAPGLREQRRIDLYPIIRWRAWGKGRTLDKVAAFTGCGRQKFERACAMGKAAEIDPEKYQYLMEQPRGKSTNSLYKQLVWRQMADIAEAAALDLTRYRDLDDAVCDISLRSNGHPETSNKVPRLWQELQRRQAEDERAFQELLSSGMKPSEAVAAMRQSLQPVTSEEQTR